MWALGVLFFKMLTGNYPFKSKKSRYLMKKILQAKVHFPIEMEIKHVILLKKMLNKRPHERPSVRRLISFFANIL